MPVQDVQLGASQEVWYGSCSRLIPHRSSSAKVHVVVVAEYRCVVKKSVINISSIFFIVFLLVIFVVILSDFFVVRYY